MQVCRSGTRSRSGRVGRAALVGLRPDLGSLPCGQATPDPVVLASQPMRPAPGQDRAVAAYLLGGLLVGGSSRPSMSVTVEEESHRGVAARSPALPLVGLQKGLWKSRG